MSAVLEKVTVGPSHPAWQGIDDDDWNGATFITWLRTLKGHDVAIRPGAEHGRKLIERMREAIVGAEARTVTVVE